MSTAQKTTDDPTIKFSDISMEEWREYTFPDGSTVVVSAPMALNVSKSGGHRVQTSSGVSYYIPSGWIALRWKSKDGHAAFQF